MSAVPPRPPLHAHLPSTSSRHRSRRVARSHARQPPSTCSTHLTRHCRCRDSFFSSSPSPPLPRRSRHHDRCLGRHHYSSSSSSSAMSSRSSSSSAERHRRPGHCHHHCHHRRHHHDLSRSSSDEWGPPAAISCAPPLHRRLESNIQRGKYVKFDHLLLPSDTHPIAGPAPSRTHGRRARELRSVVNFTSWTEA